ncbi:MAG: hypothetical protein ACJA17_000402 [Polaribacter sp.]|jgi:hypothetical protein
MRALFGLLFLVSLIANAKKDSINVDVNSSYATLQSHMCFLQSDTY